MKRPVAAALAVAILPGLPALTQDDTYGFRAGDRSFTLSGTGSSDRDYGTGSFGLSGGLSWFLTEGWEIGLRQDVNWADRNGSDNQWNGTTRAGGWYNFDLGRFKPFVGATIGYIYGDNVNETGVIGPEVGLKYFVNSTTFINAQTAYQYFFDSGSDVGDNFDNGAWIHSVGIGFRF